MDATQSSPDTVTGHIERCATALGDRVRLKQALVGLRDAAEARAHFARALFQLELAKSGDPEARSNIPAVANTLLVFWRDGSGDTLAASHPALMPLWVGAASMLISFEIKRFEQALQECWRDRDNAVRLKMAMDGLQPDDNQRVEFARCLYHLELARQGVDASRAEFARRVGLLSEAYQSPAVANELVGADAGLAHLWREVKPYLDEFFESLEEQQGQRQEPTRRVHIADVAPRESKTDPSMRAITEPVEGTARNPAMGGEGASTAPTSRVAAVSASTSPTSQVPAFEPEPSPPAAAVTAPRAVPSFRALVHDNPEFVGPAAAAPPPSTSFSSRPTLFDAELLSTSLPPPLGEPAAPTPRAGQPVAAAPPALHEAFAPTPPGGEAQPGSPPPALGDAFLPTPPGGEAQHSAPPALGDAFAPTPPGGEAQRSAPPALGDAFAPTPPGGQAMLLRPPAPPDLGEHFEPTPPGGEVEILEADEAPPLPPPPPPIVTPAQGLEAAVSIEESLDEDIDLEEEPDEPTLAFWDYTFASLQLAPVEGKKSRMLTTETRTDRKRLATYVDGLTPHAAVPEAKTFGCLVRLLLAAETKEKSLFGQSNPRRKEALAAAFALLTPTPAAAGKAAVWFELDGPETEASLQEGLALLIPFLAFCSRQQLDPTAPEAAARYLEQ